MSAIAFILAKLFSFSALKFVHIILTKIQQQQNIEGTATEAVGPKNWVRPQTENVAGIFQLGPNFPGQTNLDSWPLARRLVLQKKVDTTFWNEK